LRWIVNLENTDKVLAYGNELRRRLVTSGPMVPAKRSCRTATPPVFDDQRARLPDWRRWGLWRLAGPHAGKQRVKAARLCFLQTKRRESGSAGATACATAPPRRLAFRQ